MVVLAEPGPAWRRSQISDSSVNSQGGSKFYWNHLKTQWTSMKMHRWRNVPDGANLDRCWRSDFLHASTGFSLILPAYSPKMTFQNHENVNIINENTGKLNACNFMIFVLSEPPKWHIERARSRPSTLSFKSQRELNSYSFRPPQNIKIIKKTQGK